MSEPRTIVSLIASATEIVCALGLQEQLVGISHECDFPAEVQSLPVLSRPKLDPQKPGDQIDQRVRELVKSGLSVYEVDVDQLEALRPDLIVTQDHCEVCAVSLKDLEEATCRTTLKDTKICSLRPNSLGEVYDDFQRVANFAGIPEKGSALVQTFQKRLQSLQQKSSQLGSRPRVACLEWLSPPMLAAGWMVDLVRAAGGEPVVADEGKSFSTITWDTLHQLDPDIIVVMPCGYPVEQSLRDLKDTNLQTQLGQLRAAHDEAVWIVDGNAYFNRPGPRLLDSAEILAALLHPSHFPELQTRFAESVVAWKKP